MEIDQEIMADVEEDSMETPPDGYEGMITLVVSARISRTLATHAKAVLLASVEGKGKYRDRSCCGGAGGFGCRSLRERSQTHTLTRRGACTHNLAGPGIGKRIKSVVRRTGRWATG